MRAITLWPEWAWAVRNLGKDIENRGRAVPDRLLGHRIAIHAGVTVGGGNKKSAEVSMRLLEEVANRAGFSTDRIEEGPPWKRETVCIEFKRGEEEFVLDLKRWQGRKHKFYRGCVVATAVLREPYGNSPWRWYEDGSQGWKLDEMIPIKSPIACRGQQGIWTLPPEVEIAVRRQYDV